MMPNKTEDLASFFGFFAWIIPNNLTQKSIFRSKKAENPLDSRSQELRPRWPSSLKSLSIKNKRCRIFFLLLEFTDLCLYNIARNPTDFCCPNRKSLLWLLSQSQRAKKIQAQARDHWLKYQEESSPKVHSLLSIFFTFTLLSFKCWSIFEKAFYHSG